MWVKQQGISRTYTYLQSSHLQGMFYRTIRMISNGIKPVFVFDGKPPELKSDELEKRRVKRDEAEEAKKKLKNLVMQKVLQNLQKEQ